MPRFDLKDSIIRFSSNLIRNQVITVRIGDGNVSWSEKREIEYLLDRGRIDDVRAGDEQPVEVSLDLAWEFIKSSTSDPPTIYEVLTQTGAASDWDSADTNNTCAPYALNLSIERIPQCAGVEIEFINLSNFRYENIDFDADAATIAVSGMCNINNIAAVRTTNSFSNNGGSSVEPSDPSDPSNPTNP